MNRKVLLRFLLLPLLFSFSNAFSHEIHQVFDDAFLYQPVEEFWQQPEMNEADENGLEPDYHIYACKKASSHQLANVNHGNQMLQSFLNLCAQQTSGSPWCQQLTRPNPSSLSIFRCTYGESQPHRLIHPDTATWPDAFQAVRLVESLEDRGIKICLIYNWWRPEPYNANVGGAPGRHPFGTSIDVRFCSKSDMEKAFTQLCKWRKEGRIRAIGYYGSTGLHFGIGDATPNTWGKACP